MAWIGGSRNGGRLGLKAITIWGRLGFWPLATASPADAGCPASTWRTLAWRSHTVVSSCGLVSLRMFGGIWCLHMLAYILSGLPMACPLLHRCSDPKAAAARGIGRGPGSRHAVVKDALPADAKAVQQRPLAFGLAGLGRERPTEQHEPWPTSFFQCKKNLESLGRYQSQTVVISFEPATLRGEVLTRCDTAKLWLCLARVSARRISCLELRSCGLLSAGNALHLLAARCRSLEAVPVCLFGWLNRCLVG